MNNIVRPTDTLARWGGDEFTLLAGADVQVVIEIAERIRKEIETIDWPAGIELSDDPRRRITISCGVAEYNDNDSLDTLLNRADNALYKIKGHEADQCNIGNLGPPCKDCDKKLVSVTELD